MRFFGEGRKRQCVYGLAVVLSVTAWCDSARAQTQTFKLLPDDGAADDGFGRSVAISGNTALVGAFHDGDNGSGSGSAYLFEDVPEPATAALMLASGLLMCRRQTSRCG